MVVSDPLLKIFQIQTSAAFQISKAEKKAHFKRDLTGSRRKGGMRKADRVGQRTFPSETSRRLLATMALDCDNPQALLNLTGGVVGHVDSVLPNTDLLSDSDSSTSKMVCVKV